MKSTKHLALLCLTTLLISSFAWACTSDKKACGGQCQQQTEEKACCGTCTSQTQATCPQSCGICFSQFKPEQWNLEGVDYKVVDFKGKKALHIQKKNKDSKQDGVTAILKELDFDNGTIEFDMASKIFSGVVFRAQGQEKAERIYFRPFNSGTAKHNNSVQYVAHGSENTWKYLRQNFPGKYEAGADLKELEWFHVKLEVCCSYTKVFIDNATEPCLVVKDLKYGQSKGQVGLWAWDGYFANLKVTPKQS
ncbi:hypothetical protein ACFL6U_08465 [Planctomycetota bacterium]